MPAPAVTRAPALPLLLLLGACGAGNATSGGGGGTTYTQQPEPVATSTTTADAGAGATSGAPVDAGATSVYDAGAPSHDAGPADVATSSAAMPVDAGATTASAPLEFPVVPMRLVPVRGATGADAQLDLELRADGTIYSHDRFVGQLAGTRVLGPHGNEVLAVASDGTVRIAGAVSHIRVLATGDIQMPNGATLSFADDGTPLSTAPGQPPQRGPARLMGFRPEARATAGLLALIAATVALPPAR